MYQSTVEHKIRVAQENTLGRADTPLASASNALKRFTPRLGDAHRIHNPLSLSGGAPMPVEVQEPTPSSVELAQRYLSPVVSRLETAGYRAGGRNLHLVGGELLRDRMIR